MSKIILASSSPRRKELLNQIGIPFEVIPSDKEVMTEGLAPSELVQKLSYDKAFDVYRSITDTRSLMGASEKNVPPEITVIGADTVVACEGKIFGKPLQEEEAFFMLSLLQGRSHQVYTGVSLIWDYGSFTFSEETQVVMYPMTTEEMKAYIATGEPKDKAGAYAIQGKCAAFIQKIHGDYNNVVGLPIGRLYQEMKERKLI